MSRQGSDKTHAILDGETRLRKAKKIVAVLRQRKSNINELRVLDIGTGSGHIAHEIGRYAKEVVSVDMHDERILKKGYSFLKVNSEMIPFDDESFDIVVSNHVIEHVPNQQLHLHEISRVLKSNGIAYLATPNKYWWREPHYRLPMLSWFPRVFSNLYLQALQGAKWDIYPQTIFSIRRKAPKGIEVINEAVKIIRDPDAYELDMYKSAQSIISRIPRLGIVLLSYLAPALILVLEKGKNDN